MRRLGTVVVPISFGLLLIVACSRSGVLNKPATAGTVEQLQDTSWQTSNGVLTFRANSIVEFTPKAGSGPMPVPQNPLQGNYTLAEGVLRASIANTMPFAGTWDGKKLFIGKEECQRLTQ